MKNVKTRAFKESLLGIVVLSLGFSSCGKLPDYIVDDTENAFIAEADLNPNIDLLFVIDNSGSMERDQQVLADSFNAFIANFTDKNLQYHIGIISTDTCPYDPSTRCSASGTYWSSSGSRYNGIFNQGMGSLLTKYFATDNRLKYLTWNMDADAATAKALTISRFQNNVTLGIDGSGSEAALRTVISAIEQRNDYNQGFFRAGAFTSIIIVSDEDEGYGHAGSPSPSGGAISSTYLYTNPADQSTRINAFLASLESLKGSDLDNFSLNVVAVPASATECVIDGVAEHELDFEPAVTLKVAHDTVNTNYPPLGNGDPKARFTDICSDFSAALEEIGTDIVEANARYNLVQVPANSSEIIVTVDGVAVPRSTVNGWEYDGSTNSIQFYGTAVPSIGQRVLINYVPSAPT